MGKLLDSLKQGHFATWRKAARVLFIVFYLVVVILILFAFDIRQIQAILGQHQKLAFIISFLAIFVSAVAFIPTIPITASVALLLGPFQAVLVTGLGTTVSSLVQYQMGKQVGDVLNFADKKARLPFKLSQLPVDSPLFLFVVRFLPIGPIGLNFVCGAYQVSQFLFLWTALATNLVASALLAYGVDRVVKL
jgi:uncharacterized membrane protein YdjX (TVP38/TMEM64 family)